MAYLNFQSRYDREPEIPIPGFEDQAWEGYSAIVQQLKTELAKYANPVLTIECYPGVRYEEIKKGLIDPLQPQLVIFADELALPNEEVNKRIARLMTDDRVFGVMSRFLDLEEFYIPEYVASAQKQIANQEGLTVIYGFGASLVTKGDILVYSDLARWEIQLRYRSREIANWKADNYDEDPLKKYKRGFFFEWRIADKVKRDLLNKKQIDYLLDTNLKDQPKMITGEALYKGLETVVHRPFRLVPYFDPGVWGGQWMKEVCNLPKEAPNYAWSFDGVPEENSLYLRYGSIRVEIPAMNIVLNQPKPLLGERVFARFGNNFPIRFDLLDTMDGGNLSLQVHPLTEYIQEKFGMPYTQDESYYVLDAKEGAVCYLGVKAGIDPEAMIADLEKAQSGEVPFDDEKYINRIPMKKHDHFLIPGGTVHCQGKDAMVLEISSSAYIFTFKLWDWGRVGLDGKPRPVHINHGKENIQFDRDEHWVQQNLINRIELLEEGDGYRIERTGLHELEFIETHRHWFTKPVTHHTNGTVNVLNLVEGECALVESPEGRFEPFEVHYAETFIIPASVGAYTIRPYKESEGKLCATIKAFIRG